MEIDDVEDLYQQLDEVPRSKLVEHGMASRDGWNLATKRLAESQHLLNATRNYVDVLKRRADLIHAISDHVTENALSSDQLEMMATIAWPSLVKPNRRIDISELIPLAGRESTTDISEPTRPLMSPGTVWDALIEARKLMEIANGFLEAIEKMPIDLGTAMGTQIGEWRGRIDSWTRETGVLDTL